MAKRLWSPTMTPEPIDPQDVVDYVFDFTALLDGDTITGTPTAVGIQCTAAVAASTTTTVTVRVSGTAVGASALAKVHIVTLSGQAYDRTVPFTGVEL